MTTTDAALRQLSAQFHKALAFHRQGQLALAQAVYEQILEIQPRNAHALHLLGVIAAQMQNPRKAVELIGAAIELNPNVAAAYNNRGSALKELGRFEEAMADYDRAIAIEAGYAEAYFNRGVVLYELKQLTAALASYTQAIAAKPNFAGAYFNRGIVLRELRQLEAALASYDRAIAIKADYVEAYLNRGNVLSDLQQFPAALASYDRVISIRPDYAAAYVSRAKVFLDLKQYETAIASFDRAAALKPDFKFLQSLRRHARMQVCDWGDFDVDVTNLHAGIERQELVSQPFPLLALSESGLSHRKAAELYVREECPPNQALSAILERPRHDRIRIGYFSADFRDHPVVTLAAELFETHDRSRFETTAFSFGPDTQDTMRRRMERAFDRFIDVRGSSNADIALLARSLEIDIAVDLMAFTAECRPQIFALRAAPVQVNFLGYPGTMGAPYMDYLIADRTLIPEDSQSHYSEKIIYLPNSYQVNDAKRPVAEVRFTREDLGLPPSGFVFCCFNNSYKITPGTFDSWMRILSRVEGSVLWLLEDNASVANNLRREAVRRNVHAERLVFARRVPMPEHLARLRVGDLFIDTLPYNAHTTASEALWVGLPLVTCLGETFAGRVAASLLKAIDLPELITSNREQFVELAVELATDAPRLAKIREKLADNRLTTPLFDAQLFARHIEAAYTLIDERYHAGLPPEHTYIGCD
jgi:predicted O-linked N-acetylglucosamine transferase (SPINDLY family)